MEQIDTPAGGKKSSHPPYVVLPAEGRKLFGRAARARETWRGSHGRMKAWPEGERGHDERRLAKKCAKRGVRLRWPAILRRPFAHAIVFAALYSSIDLML